MISRSWINKRVLLFLLILSVGAVFCKNESVTITVSSQDITIIINEKIQTYITVNGSLSDNVTINFLNQHSSICDISPENLYLTANTDLYNNTVTIIGRNAGHSEITSSSVPNYDWITKQLYYRVTVANSWIIWHISIIFGWIYFLAWSISFYPQIYSNWKRKSVIGLNFDFISFNICGFTLYSIFNIGLFFITEIKTEYSRRYPRGLNPVLINDLFFSLHAVFATFLLIIQCLLYERGNQRVSLIGRGILSVFGLILIISAILAGINTFHWIDFLYICSYIKLVITLIKYVPQAIMNYRRKSTVGWSIGNIILDFVGGSLSMLQMVLNAYNYDDWASIFGDPTKFGLGLFSVCFDIFFFLQHYVFYRSNNVAIKNQLNESETVTTTEELEYEIKN